MAEPARKILPTVGTADDPSRTDASSTPRKAIHSSYLSEAADISRVLITLRDQRADLQLRFDGDPITYQAKVLDVLSDAYLIEDVQPRAGLKLMRKGNAFSMSSRFAGTYVHSNDNSITKVDSERGVPFFHVQLPGSLLHQQRRKAARYALPMRVTADGARVVLYLNGDNQESLEGRVIDISAGGCRAEFETPAEPSIEQNEEVRSAINIPNVLDLSSKAAIRHFTYNSRKKTLTCGIELTEMHVTDRRRLEQFIQSISRVADRG